ALAERLALRNEFEPGGAQAPDTIAYLRRLGATPGDVGDERLLHADAIVHVASATAGAVVELCHEAARLLAPAIEAEALGGVVRPPTYTGKAMHDFAYAHRIVQQPGTVMPNAFLVPMSKTAAWWRKDWMERHTYFLPRYDDSGRLVSEGHALAAAPGIACLLRRTYKHVEEPAPAGAYDFLNYFECTDAETPAFHAVCAALRDVARNPEWRFVREGPTPDGRAVGAGQGRFS